ncbi:hypothetical protein GEU84_008035 [Fertoebacter nigrum]|uniref:Uncharacterized protein n=1 Tax=Fertoeibacter niger TaxID=2656921 RepID=A0A8X8GU04_9RHOB|nr:hypothetical protein [Fertoeibacter niger]NUB44328.1 hypothetical protein [Fertoeibacter niger]
MSCQMPHPGDMPLEQAGLDGFETGLLALLRHFCASFATPETQGWVLAFRIAVERWGPRDGPATGQALLAVAQAMRLTRRSVFVFSNPLCPGCRAVITPNERHMMRMIHAARRGRAGEARAEAMLLCEGQDTTHLLQAVEALAALFPPSADDRPLPRSLAALRLH